LISNIDQKITLIQRRGIVSISGTATISPSSVGDESRVVDLKAGKSVEIVLTVNETPVNLALGQPVKVSSIADNKPATNAVDGNTGTRWSSAYADNEWIYVDLGSFKNINEVKLNWETAYANSYKIQVSDNEKTWKEVYFTTNGKGEIESIPLSEVCRYVRMLGEKRSTEYGYSLWEFEIYGTGINTNLENIISSENNRLDIFPNPANEILYIREIENFDIKIFDLNGNKILEPLKNNGFIDISLLKVGAYILQASSDNKKYSKVFLKQ